MASNQVVAPGAVPELPPNQIHSFERDLNKCIINQNGILIVFYQPKSVFYWNPKWSAWSIWHTRAPSSKNSMKMRGLVWTLGFQTINSLKRWNHQFETQIRRHIFQLEVDNFQPVWKQTFKLEPVRNQFENSSAGFEIENAGNSAPELYSSKPVRKQPPVWTMELLTITSPEMLNFLTKRWTGMHMNTCSSISLQIMNGQIEFLTTTTKYFLKSGNVQTSENVYFLEKTTAGCPADRTQLLKIFWSNSESFQANFNI